MQKGSAELSKIMEDFSTQDFDKGKWSDWPIP